LIKHDRPDVNTESFPLLTVETKLYLEGKEEIRERYEAVHSIVHEDNSETVGVYQLLGDPFR